MELVLDVLGVMSASFLGTLAALVVVMFVTKHGEDVKEPVVFIDEDKV